MKRSQGRLAGSPGCGGNTVFSLWPLTGQRDLLSSDKDQRVETEVMRPEGCRWGCGQCPPVLRTTQELNLPTPSGRYGWKPRFKYPRRSLHIFKPLLIYILLPVSSEI